MNSRSTLATTLSLRTEHFSSACIAALACGLALLFFDSNSVAQELKVLYRNDSELTATLSEATIDWVTVAKSGDLIERKVELTEIKSLSLSRGKSSELLSQIRQSITRLGDADYVVREKAEAELAKQGGPFKDLLKPLEDSPSMEVRHRAGRLLKDFSKRTFPPLELDTLTLSSGRTLEGEARNFSMTGLYRDSPIKLDRNNVAQLSQAKASTNEGTGPDDVDVDALPPSPSPVKTTIFHKHTDFSDPNQTEFRFETDVQGAPFRDRANVDLAFADDGLLFRNEQTGYVGVSVFSFKYQDLPVGGRSVCLYGRGRNRKQFQGFMEIRFCVPGKPNLPAGVKEVGLFIARVKHSRDIVMEAYNAQGHVLATVEATDQQCVFAGVKSNEPITRLRIFSSPWLEKLSRKIDVDFAIDTLRMSAPIPLRTVAALPPKGQSVELANGDRLNINSINTTDDGDLRIQIRGINIRAPNQIIKQGELASIHLVPKVAENPPWKAMLPDGSVLGVSPGNKIESELLQEEFSMTDFVALWPGSSPARYSIDGDWIEDQAMVVFPTCRIRTDPFQFGVKGVSWTVNKKIQQQVMLGREDPQAKENQEDPTPSETSFDYADTAAAQLPTFWNKQPVLYRSAPNTGFIELNDGQRFMLGKGKTFQLELLKKRQAQLTWMDQKPVVIPLKQVRTIIFPK